MSSLLADLRFAARGLARDRVYATIAFLTLAFGIGATVVIFAIVDGVLLRPMAYREPGRLVMINEIVPELAASYPQLPVNARHFVEWRHRCRSFQQIGIMDGNQLILSGAGEPERLEAVRVSASLLPTLGVQPQLGRSFREEDDQPGHDRVVIISDALWARRFGRDRGVVGRTVTLDGIPFVVVGVLPASFHLPEARQFGGTVGAVDLMKPIAFRTEDLHWFGEFNYPVVARLKPGVSREQALAELNVLQADIAIQAGEGAHLKALITDLQEEVTGPSRKPLLILFGAVGVVLLIVCVNLANLTLARSAARARDQAIRSALGASRADLIRSALTETFLLALAGGAAGVAIAWAGLRLVLANAPLDVPRLYDIHLDARVLLFSFGLSLVTAVLFGILPALRVASQDVQRSLSTTSRTSTEGRRGLRTRRLLVAVESALGLVLLVVAGLLGVSFVRVLRVDQGFDAGHVVSARITLPRAGYTEDEQREAYYRRLVAKLQAIPGVTSAAIVSRLPLEGEDWVDAIRKEDDKRPLFELPPANYRFCSPEYFRAMGIPFTAGDGFTEADRHRHLAIISESAARRIWPGMNPVGRTFHRANPDEPPFEIAGVVRDVRVGPTEDPVNTVYVPYWYRSRLFMTAILRTAMDPRAIMRPLRVAAWSVEPQTAVGDVRALDEVVSDSVAQRRFQVWLTAAFALSALALACLGIYGVVSWSVARRRNEIGIRMALGAGRAAVRRMVVTEGMRPVLAGLVAGVGLALAAGRVMASMLFGVTPHDPLVIAGVSVLLALVAAGACYLPARRATLADPLGALRCE